MRQYKWLFRLTFILLICLSALPALAQQNPTQTYTDDVVTFNYPEDWFKCTCPDDHNTLALGNTEEAPNTDDLQRDEVQILVVKSAARFMDEMFETELVAETPEDVLTYFGFDYDEMDVYEFDDNRTAAAAFLSNKETRLESLFVSIDLGDGSFGMFIATARPRDLGQFEDTIIEIASSFVAADADDTRTSRSGSKSSSLGGKRSNNSSGDAEIELTETLNLEDARFEFDFPENWIAFEDEGVAILVNHEDVLELEDLSDLASGEVLVFIYPTVDALPDYEFEVDKSTRPSTIVSYYASMAMIYGMEQQGPMGEPEIGDGDLLTSNYYAILDGEYDEYVLAIEDGEGDIVTLIAYSAPEEMPDFEETLNAIAATFQVR